MTHNLAFILIQEVIKSNEYPQVDFAQLTELVQHATLLHECAALEYPTDNPAEHSLECADLAQRWISEHRLPTEFAQAVYFIISCHNSIGYDEYFQSATKIGKYDKQTLQLAAQIVYDADKLQTLGLFGILRAVASGRISLPIDRESIEAIALQNEKLKLEASKHTAIILGPRIPNNLSYKLEKLYQRLIAISVSTGLR